MGVASGTVYVANEAGNTVTPIRAASNTAGRPIKVGPAPALIAISPDGQTAYVVGIGSLRPGAAAPVTLTAIRTATNKPGRVITVCAPGNLSGAIAIAPDTIAITPDSRTVYVSCPGTGQVVPVRAGADTAAEPIRVPSPGALAMAAGGKTVYVANSGAGTITPISTATEEPGPPVIVGPSPDAMAVAPDGRTVLVLTATGITPVDAPTNRAGQPVAIQGACALAVAPDGGTAYVLAMPDSGSQQGFVVPVPVHGSAAGKPIKVGLNPVQIVFTPDGKMAYVANYASESVTPIQLPRRPGRAADRRREDPGPAGGQPGRHDGIRARFEHIRRDGPGNAVQRDGRNAGPHAVQHAGEEAALLAGPGHSDPRRDELRRQTHQGGQAPDRHRDRPMSHAEATG
jgi:DNA-binding beta-propeller fold protein YncE